MSSLPCLPPRPSRNLVGKVAIVTGAGSIGDGLGNGRAISILLSEARASVLCSDRDVSAAQRTVEMISQLGLSGCAVAFPADVSSEENCKMLVDAAVRIFGRVDILVNNVGIMGAKGTALESSAEEWAKGLEVNVTSMMLMAKYAIPAMLKNEPEDGIRGSIVNLGSIAGFQGGTPSLFYPTSKGAVVNMTRAMAANHGHQGIRVNCVCPGFLYTPMVSADGMSERVRAERRKQGLLKTEGNAWDCAAAVRFLASGEARWITGTSLTVDAGATSSVVMPE